MSDPIKNPPSRFEAFLWFCAGADRDILARCPGSDRVKYQGIGGIIFATGVLAFVSSSYAFWTVFSPKGPALASGDVSSTPALVGALLAGLVWGLVIFNIDRFIVSSTGSGDGTEAISLTELLQATPRIIMAMLIGICLSKPLELRILEPEINAELQRRQSIAYQDAQLAVRQELKVDEARLDNELARLENEIKQNTTLLRESKAKIDEQYRLLELEAEGRSGSGKAGRGPAWKDKKENLDRQLADYQEERARVDKENESLSEKVLRERDKVDQLHLEEEAKLKVQSDIINQSGGLLERLDIAHEKALVLSWVLTLLLLMIETGPIFFKLMIPAGVYDRLKEQEKQLTMAEAGIFIRRETVSEDGSKEIETIVDAKLERQQAERDIQRETELALLRRIHDEYLQRMHAEIDADPERFIQERL